MSWQSTLMIEMSSPFGVGVVTCKRITDLADDIMEEAQFLNAVACVKHVESCIANDVIRHIRASFEGLNVEAAPTDARLMIWHPRQEERLGSRSCSRGRIWTATTMKTIMPGALNALTRPYTDLTRRSVSKVLQDIPARTRERLTALAA